MSRPQVLGDRVKHWGALPEHGMRRERLSAYFTAVSPASAACAIEELLVQTRAKQAEAVAAYLAMVEMLTHGARFTAEREAWRREAYRRGMVEVCYLLIEPPVFADGQDEDEPQIHPALQELTLGEKKALARVILEKDIEKFVNETDIRVLEILFRHPSLTSKYVIRMLARRPQRPEVFRSIVSHPRWLSAGDVQKAIVFNPYAPPGVALKLLPLLRVADIREAANSTQLAPSIRAYAQRLRVLRTYVPDDLAGLAVGVRFDVSET